MSTQVVVCPGCKREIPLSDALEATAQQELQRRREEFKAQIEQQVRETLKTEVDGLRQENDKKDQRINELIQAEVKLRRDRQELEEAKRDQELELARRLDEERSQIRERAKQETLEQHRLQDAQKDRELQELRGLQEEHKQREAQLLERERDFDRRVEKEVHEQRAALEQAAEKQVTARYASQLALLKRGNEEKDLRLREMEAKELELHQAKEKLEADRRRMELDVARRLGEERERIRLEAVIEADEQHRLKEREKDKQLTDLREQLEVMKRKMEQGSQQLQGEVLEIDLEELLTGEFSEDTIEPVRKGVQGADVLQRVNSASGRYCGMIVWETKRTQKWSEGWVQKLKDNQRQANGEIAVLVTDMLPKDIRDLGYRDGVWVTDYRHAMILATALRMQILKVGQLKQAMDGKQEKAEVLYAYLTSVEFRHRVETMVEAFARMQGDIELERRTMERIWAKREKELSRVVDNLSGMYGDLQGLVGNTLPAIKSLALPSASEPVEPEPSVQADSDVPF